MTRRALITGITGQDGSYLAEFLLKKGYEVHGIVRRASHEQLQRLVDILPRIQLHQADLLDETSLLRVLHKTEPQEVYNLAAQSFVPTSWTQPLFTGEITGLGVLRMLEAVRQHNDRVRFFQASSSEMFGQATEEPQTETTSLSPRSPYGSAKAYGHFITINYRESYDMFAVSGILFNHESPRRGFDFVSRKITRAVASIKLGKQTKVQLGNLDVYRDWGYAADFIEAMWLMLNAENPEDYVIATGKKHSVRELAEIAFSHVGLSWENHVEIDPQLYRPAEVCALCGNSDRIRARLGWEPQVPFEALIRMMVDADLAMLTREEI